MDETLQENNKDISRRPFERLNHVDPSDLLRSLEQELPQTIAVVLSFMEPDRASVILQNLSSDVQSEVLRRIAEMDIVSPEVCHAVESALEENLSGLPHAFMVHGGVENACEILSFVDRATEKYLIFKMEEYDPELTEEIKKRLFEFEDIVKLDDRSLQKVMLELDSQELVMALKGADSNVKEKIFRNMSKRASTMLKEDMEYVGPVRLMDVENAQNKIISIIRQLEDSGIIVVPRPGEFDFSTQNERGK